MVGRYRCTICNKPNDTVAKLRSHVGKEHKNAVLCETCQHVSRNEAEHENHVMEHRPKQPRPYSCNIGKCCHEYLTLHLLLQHFPVFHPEIPFEDACALCNVQPQND